MKGIQLLYDVVKMDKGIATDPIWNWRRY